MNRLVWILLLSSIYVTSGAQPIGRHQIVQISHNPMGTFRTTDLVYNPSLAPFYHGVASGDPEETRVIIWTRVTPDTLNVQPNISGTYEMATDTGFGNVVKNGTFVTDTATDYTVKIDVTGLQPGSTYYYRFQTGNKRSLTGRAKTLPTAAQAQHLKFAIVSCSNYEGGYFNAYAKIAARNDLDAVVHLGDYIYEYEQGAYGINLPNRTTEPSTEILVLSDYRTRYSLYRLDPDLIRLHQQHTFINIWDDHESANDSYMDGAENHQPNEGSWEDRKAISKKVYFEWIPIRNNATDKVYRNLSYGNLADLIMLDTRLEGRTKPPVNFDDPDTASSGIRTMMSSTQMGWLNDRIKAPVSKWKIIGNQVLYSIFNVGFGAGFGDGTPDPTNIDSIRVAENLFIDNWESYPTQRHELLDTLKNNPTSNVVFVTGDSHCSWAFDVPDSAVIYPDPLALNLPTPKAYDSIKRSGYNPTTQEGSWAVEYATPSISSPNFDEAAGATTAATLELFMNTAIPFIPGNPVYNPHLKYVDLDRHGYFILDIKEDSVHADYYYMSRIDTNYATETMGKALVTYANSNKVSIAGGAAGPKAVQDVPTPLFPSSPVSVGAIAQPAVLFAAYPNPVSEDLYVQLGLAQATSMRVDAMGIDGKMVVNLIPAKAYNKGVYNLKLSTSELPRGVYILVFKGDSFSKTLKIVKD
jgi:alkaline phosphatase D